MSGARMVPMTREQRDWWASYADAHREQLRVGCLEDDEAAYWTDTAERIDALVAAFDAAEAST